LNHYKGIKGFSYFFVPDRLIDFVPQIGGFTLELWLLLHYRIQHNRVGAWTLFTDDQIATHSIWGGRSISLKEISRARALLKKLGLLAYSKEDKAYKYFVVHPVSGMPLDKEQAEIERKKTQKEPAKTSREVELEAELASLRKQLATQAPAMRVPVWEDAFDTGQVD
jgi:hypothetical protein